MTELCLLLTVTSPGWGLTPGPRAHLPGQCTAWLREPRLREVESGALAVVSYLCQTGITSAPRAVDKELISHKALA